VFGIGTGELLVIAIIALLLFPPHELPKMLRSVAKAWGTVRRTADEFRDAIMQEEAMKEVKDAYKGAKADLRKAEVDARRELMKARVEARKAEAKLMKVSKERERVAAETEAKKLEAGEGATAPEGGSEAPGPAEGDDESPGPLGTVAAKAPTAPVRPPPPSADRASEQAQVTRERIAQAQATRDRLAAEQRAAREAAAAGPKVPAPPQTGGAAGGDKGDDATSQGAA